MSHSNDYIILGGESLNFAYMCGISAYLSYSTLLYTAFHEIVLKAMALFSDTYGVMACGLE